MKYLALGDSYTIGEQVDYNLNFPSQTTRLLQQQGIPVVLDKLTATTGWTTDELATALANDPPTHDYDWVTLLIGVNNQYRGRSTEEYHWQFYSLLCQSILYAQGRADRVIVLSIPDWGLTPFNTDRDRISTSQEIDAYNLINKRLAEQLHTHYIDVTSSTRAHASDPHFLAPDMLHYAAPEYALWAQQVASIILTHCS